jgi:hypothetical protein
MEWSRDNRRQRAGKSLKDSNLGPQNHKALPGFRVSSSGFLSVNAGLYGSAQGAARKWDQLFESALLQQAVCLSGERRGCTGKAPHFGGILRVAGDVRRDVQAANRASFALSL